MMWEIVSFTSPRLASARVVIHAEAILENFCLFDVLVTLSSSSSLLLLSSSLLSLLSPLLYKARGPFEIFDGIAVVAFFFKKTNLYVIRKKNRRFFQMTPLRFNESFCHIA